MKKKLTVNAVFNVIQTIASMVFPLITFPYVSRVLGVETMGKYSFGQSIVNYFVLLSGLGINTYAVREGSKYRDDKMQLAKFAEEVFSINVYSTIIGYLFLGICLAVFNQLQEYMAVICVLSTQILFVTIGRIWIYSIFEDFRFIAVRTIVLHCVTTILVFLFVHSPEDLIIYTWVNVIGIIGVNIVGLYSSQKYCRISFRPLINTLHIKPIILIFSISVSIIIYTSSDITVLGLLTSNRNVGLYSASVKIYNIIKQLLASILIVTVPRFSYYVGIKDKESFRLLFNKVFSILLFFMLPAAVGLSCVSKDCILILAGGSYIESYQSLIILSYAIVFNLISFMFGYCVLIPNNKEAVFFGATLASSVINITLNFFLIPIYKENAAAFTTLLSECVVALICFLFSRKQIYVSHILHKALSLLLGCGWIMVGCLIITNTIPCNTCEHLLLCIAVSLGGYLAIQVITKNPILNYRKITICRD